MSTIVYTEDFISIVWEIKEISTNSLIKVSENDFWTDLEEDISRQLHLIFTIQVNWKLKHFQWHFVLEKYNSWLGLKDWGEWYAIIGLISSLGYKIWEYEEWKAWANIIH